MQLTTLAITVAGSLWLLSSLGTQSWSLPPGAAVEDRGPRTYRVTMDHTVADVTGQVVQRQRISGEYTRGLPDGHAVWKNVTVAQSDGPAEITGPGQKREFMEGFRYRSGSAGLGDTMTPEFFESFPPDAIFERNLVWDMGMIEMFGQDYFDHLKLNEPYRVFSGQDVDMPGVGTFRNRDIHLTWVGQSRRNGEDCAVIEYHAYFNPLEIANPGLTMDARSHYWGTIWVSLETRQIEYATLQEDVLGQMTLAGQDTAEIVSVFRTGVFEPEVRK